MDQHFSSTAPKKNSRFTQTLWPIHRIEATSAQLHPNDFKLLNGNNIMHYPLNDNDNKPCGVSCFVPLDNPHNVPSNRLDYPVCYFLPSKTALPNGLALIFTHKMKLRFPSNVRQNGWHFNIFPTVPMTMDNYAKAVKNLDWHLCTIKAAALPNELVCADDDMDGMKDFRMHGLYNLMYVWYNQAMNAMDRIYANDIHTWIVMNKPSFQDLLQHEPRSHIVFSALSQTYVQSVILIIYQSDILIELENAFGWSVTKFRTDCKIVQQTDFKIGKKAINIQPAVQVLYKLPEKWSLKQVINFPKSKSHLNEDNNIKKVAWSKSSFV